MFVRSLTHSLARWLVGWLESLNSGDHTRVSLSMCILFIYNTLHVLPVVVILVVVVVVEKRFGGEKWQLAAVQCTEEGVVRFHFHSEQNAHTHTQFCARGFVFQLVTYVYTWCFVHVKPPSFVCIY